jgi:hypothetical protein
MLGRLPVLSNGSTRSASPWTTSTGTSILGRSARKSDCQVVTHSTTAMADIPTATLKLAL